MVRALFAEQFPMFDPDQTPKMLLLRRKKDYEDLFSFVGVSKIKMVSYVASPSKLLKYLEENETLKIELVLGEGLTGKEYKSHLQKEESAISEKLAGFLKEGRLTILTPPRTNHSKFYILYAPLYVRIIQTSANLTETASQPSRQNNNAFYWDLRYDSKLLKEFEKHYEDHTRECDLFMGDLIELFKKNLTDSTQHLIQTWLTYDDSAASEDSVDKLFDQLATAVSDTTPRQGEDPIVQLTIPDNLRKGKKLERPLKGLDHKIHDRNLTFRRSDYLYCINETHGVPSLLFRPERKEMTLGLRGDIKQISQPPTSPQEVSNCLEHLEQYLDTVNNGETNKPLQVQTSMFETLLYLFSAPFFTEFIKDKQKRYGSLDKRGPRYLYIYGPSSNGKTTFLKFALTLMTGKTNMAPLGRDDFNKTKILNQSILGSCFPLIFDDVNLQGKPLEDVIKTHWENRWTSDKENYPQIVITSNESKLKNWAKSRTKTVAFDILFANSSKNLEKLNELFNKESNLYSWFTFLYMEKLQKGVNYENDELFLGREVIKDLYKFAKHPIPAYFPQQKLEDLYDPGLDSWQLMLYTLKKATLTNENGMTLVKFSEDMEHWEIRSYISDLPQVIKHSRKGKTIAIENPKEFSEWLGNNDKNKSPRNLWGILR